MDILTFQLQPLPLYNKLLVVLINLIALVLAVVVYKNNPRGKLNRTFILTAMWMLAWVNFAYLARLIGKSNLILAELSLKIAWFATPLFFSFVYLLAVYITGLEKKYKILTVSVITLGFILAVATGFTDYIVGGIRFFGGIDLRIDYGTGMFPFLGIIVLFIVAAFYVLARGYKDAEGQSKRKIEYFLFGAFVFYLANLIFNITLPVLFDIVRLYWIGDYSTIFLLSFIAYAIVTQELFGIKVVLTQGLVVAIASILLWQSVVAIPNWFEFSWRAALFLLFIAFGYFLVQSVMREIEQRKQMARAYAIEKKAKEDMARALAIEKKAKEELEKIDKLKDQFLSQAQHDLRTPLTAIMGYSDLLLNGTFGKISNKTAEVIKKIEDVTKNMKERADSFLDVAQFKLGKGAVDLKDNVILQDIMQEIKNELEFKAGQKKIDLKLEVPDQKVSVKADRQKLKAAIYNIVDNAIKYTNQGSVTVLVNPKSQILNSKQIPNSNNQNSNSVLVEVRDTGIGIPKDNLATIFETKYERGDQAQKITEGKGVGLYLSAQVIKLHGGKVWAESEGEGKGSTFYIELPV